MNTGNPGFSTDHSLQRQAAIANAGIADHAADLELHPIPNFDLGRTIFHTLSGSVPRFVIKKRIAKEPTWTPDGRTRVESAYAASHAASAAPLPAVSEDLRGFLMRECDFDVEHADGSFLDHLTFCYEYTHRHFPGHPPLVMLLHSILGTGTNTFAMSAEKLPDLKSLVEESDAGTNGVAWRHIEIFPSMLRLLYGIDLRRDLRANRERLDALRGIRLRRVIDNAARELSADDFWAHLNYQLIHLVDFVPISNWRVRASDPGFIVFRDLYELLRTTGRLHAHVAYDATADTPPVRGERRGFSGWLVDQIPVSLSEKMTAKSIRRFSDGIGHSLDYELLWD